MRSIFSIVLGAMIAALCINPAVAKTGASGVEIQFSVGKSSAVVDGTLRGNKANSHRFYARQGQRLDLFLDTSRPAVFFSLYAPGNSLEPIATSNLIGGLIPGLNRFSGRLPKTGEYRITIFQLVPPNSDRRANYSLDIAISGGSAISPGRPEQLPGGGPTSREPDYWRVTGLSTGDTLNVRSGPSTTNPIVVRLYAGDVVRNLGCQMISTSSRWCRVQFGTQTRSSGWASARYLSPASGPGNATQLPGEAPTQLPGDALVPGTNYNATGQLDCRIDNRSRQCAFGVIRRGQGNATLVVTLPGGQSRRIEFEAGRPVYSNGGEVWGEWSGDTVVVSIGTNERITVFNAILFGG